MSWDEFADLVRGLSGGTALANVVEIRTETDREAVNRMTPAQRRMRADWQRRRALQRTEQETRDYLATMQAAFAAAFGGD